jgi:hypothetical protein
MGIETLENLANLQVSGIQPGAASLRQLGTTSEFSSDFVGTLTCLLTIPRFPLPQTQLTAAFGTMAPRLYVEMMTEPLGLTVAK